MNNRIDNPECNSGTEWERETIDEWLESRLRGFSLGREYLGKWDERRLVENLDEWNSLSLFVARETEWEGKKKKEEEKRKARVDLGVASAFDKRCARRAPVARATCGRGREEKGHLNYSFLKRAWLFLGALCACERAPRERGGRTKKKRHPHIYQPPSRGAALLLLLRRRWLQEAKRDAFFSSLNRTQLLRLSLSLIL